MTKQGNDVKYHLNGNGRILGMFHKDSAIGYAASILKDEKQHDVIDVLAKVLQDTRKVTGYFMLRRLQEQTAERGVAKVYLNWQNKTVRMKLLPQPEPVPVAPPKLVLIPPTLNPEKQLLIAQNWVRGLVFDGATHGKMYTLKELIRHAENVYAEPLNKKLVKKAVKTERDRGGMKIEDGVLHLTGN